MFNIAFEGIHPTFRQVPPSEPLFSIHAVCAKQKKGIKYERRYKREKQHTHPQTELGSLDRCDVSTGTYGLVSAPAPERSIRMHKHTSTNYNSVIWLRLAGHGSTSLEAEAAHT